MEGFTVNRYTDRFDEGISLMAKYIQTGQIKTKESIVHGYEKTPEAFIGLFSGQNIGKMIVKI